MSEKRSGSVVEVVPALTPERQGYVASLGRFPEEEAKKIARRRGASHLREELVAAGRLGAVRAAASYTVMEGATFRDYAKYFIRGAVYDVLRQEARQRDVRIAGEMASALGYWQVLPSREDRVDPMHDDEHACRAKLSSSTKVKVSAMTVAFWLETERADIGPDMIAAMRPFMDVMRTAFAALRASDQTLLQCVHFQGMTLYDAAKQAGIAPSTAKVRHKRLLLELRSAFKKRGL